MQAWWGSFAFGVNAAEVTNDTQATISPQGLPLRYTSTYFVKAVIDGTSQSDLSNKEAALRIALARPKQDFILRTDSGAASSAAIISQATMSGTRVRGIKFEEAQGGEFVNRRTVRFVIDAEYLIANAANAIVSWTETVRITGTGGPRMVWRYPINAAGVLQEVSPFSPVMATQSGQAIGHTRRPNAPAPLWPWPILKNESVTLGSNAPEFLGQAYINFGIDWSYSFERGDGPLFGVAGLPPGVV